MKSKKSKMPATRLSDEDAPQSVVPEKTPPAEASQSVDEKNGSPAIVTATVVSLPPNRKILLALVRGEKCRVKVYDQANFIPAMAIPVRHVQADLWEYVGRAPRFRGRI